MRRGEVQERESLRRARAEKAFARAVEELDNFLYAYDLPAGLAELKPRISAQRLEIFKSLCTYYSSATHNSDWAPTNVFENTGVVFAIRGPRGADTKRDLAFNSTPLRSKTHSIRFSPEYKPAGAPPSSFTAFAHVVLLFHNGKPIVFVPAFQKVATPSSTKWKFVDKFDKVQGPGRHFAFLALAQKVAEKMRALGVRAELHVPVAQHIATDLSVTSDVRKRIEKPFEQLTKHFNGDSIQVHGVEINTINLSRPKTQSA